MCQLLPKRSQPIMAHRSTDTQQYKSFCQSPWEFDI